MQIPCKNSSTIQKSSVILASVNMVLTMKYNEHQLRLLCEMLEFIEAFRRGELSYYLLVGNLESALDAGEFKNEEMVELWYDYWGPLEIWNATKGDSVIIEDVNPDLSNMESFLKRILSEVQ